MERQYEGTSQQSQPARSPVHGATEDTVNTDETMRPLDPRVRALWWTVSAIVLVIVVILAAAAGLLLQDGWGGLPPVLAFVFGTPLAVLLPWVRYRRWRFALRADDLWIRRGVIWRNTSVIPYARLQFVDTTQGPFDRAFGLSQLVVHTAAPGTSGHLPGLAVDEAELLRERLAQVRSTDRDV